jgi:hypothetical protein
VGNLDPKPVIFTWIIDSHSSAFFLALAKPKATGPTAGGLQIINRKRRTIKKGEKCLGVFLTPELQLSKGQMRS